MNRTILIIGTILGLTAVILGAFGAHGLEGYLDQNAIDSFETGVRYQMYHALLLLVVGGALNFKQSVKNTLMYLLVIGVICFSGSIYFLTTQPLTGVDFSGIALITPLGGSLLIMAWGLILYHLFKMKA